MESRSEERFEAYIFPEGEMLDRCWVLRGKGYWIGKWWEVVGFEEGRIVRDVEILGGMVTKIREDMATSQTAGIWTGEEQGPRVYY